MKKTYLKPEAEFISFLAEEDIAAIIGGDMSTGDQIEDGIE